MFNIGDVVRCKIKGYHTDEIGVIVGIWNNSLRDIGIWNDRLPYKVKFDEYDLYDYMPGFSATDLELVEKKKTIPLPLPG